METSAAHVRVKSSRMM